MTWELLLPAAGAKKAPSTPRMGARRGLFLMLVKRKLPDVFSFFCWNSSRTCASGESGDQAGLHGDNDQAGRFKGRRLALRDSECERGASSRAPLRRGARLGILTRGLRA